MRRKKEGRKVVTGMLCGAILLGVSIALTACGKATEAGATLPGTTVGATTKAGPETAKPETEKEETTTEPEQATEELSAAATEGADDGLEVDSREREVIEDTRNRIKKGGARREWDKERLIGMIDNPYMEEVDRQKARNLLEILETITRSEVEAELDSLLEDEGFLAGTNVLLSYSEFEEIYVEEEKVEVYYDPALVAEITLCNSQLSVDDEEREKQIEKVKDIAARTLETSVDEIQITATGWYYREVWESKRAEEDKAAGR